MRVRGPMDHDNTDDDIKPSLPSGWWIGVLLYIAGICVLCFVLGRLTA